MTTFTRKFSQFVPEAVTEVVGLTAGANAIGPNTGGGASITYTFTQAAVVPDPLYLGAAVRVDVATGLWECTLATTPLGAEFYAFIIAIAGDVYTVQFAGPVPAGTPNLTGLINGTPYYLSDTVAGGISAIPPAIGGEVNLPVLWAMDNGNSVIKMSRGYVVGAGMGGGGGGGGCTCPPNNIATVTQNPNTFAVGDVLYLSGDMTFSLANAYSTLNAAQAEWVVTSIVTPGVSFTIQQGGQVVGVILTDGLGNPIASNTIYYVSPTIGQEGKLTSIAPTGITQFTKPFYVQQEASNHTGWLLDQRPLPVSSLTNPVIKTINIANTFTPGQWVYMSGDDTYALGFGDTLAHSQVAGLVIQASATEFTLQQSGYVTGIVTGTFTDQGIPVSSSNVYYLSNITAGNITSVVPGAGVISKPCYIQQDVATNTGEILPQRPLITTPIGGHVFLGQLNAANNFDSTQGVPFVLGGFSIYYLEMNIGAFNSGIGVSGGAAASIGIQLFLNGAYYTGTNYAHLCSGVNTTANSPGTGVLWGNVRPGTGDNSLILFPAIGGSHLFLGALTGTLNISPNNTTVILQYEAFVADLTNFPPTSVNYTSAGLSQMGQPGVCTGLRIAFGGGGTLIAGSSSFINVYGEQGS